MSQSSRFLHVLRLTQSALLALLTALLIPVQVAAENNQDGSKHHHYKLIDMGTFGGPQSYVPVDELLSTGLELNNSGVFVGFADTATRIVQLFGRCQSHCFAAIEVEHSTESLLPADHPNSLYRARHRPDQPIVQPLMISLPMVMRHVFGHGTA